MKIKTWFKGRGFLYFLNAYTDAELAGELVGYYKSGEIDEVGNERARDLIEVVKGRREVLSVAYCQYCFNGWYDYICGKVFERLLGEKLEIEVAQGFESGEVYSEIGSGWIGWVWATVYPLLWLLAGKVPNRKVFSGRFGVDEGDLGKPVVIKNCMVVQRENVKSNKIERRSVEFEKTEKSKRIMRYVNEKKDRDGLLRVIKSTLRAASFWDKVFCRFLSWRFVILKMVKIYDVR